MKQNQYCYLYTLISLTNPTERTKQEINANKRII